MGKDQSEKQNERVVFYISVLTPLLTSQVQLIRVVSIETNLLTKHSHNQSGNKEIGSIVV